GPPHLLPMQPDHRATLDHLPRGHYRVDVTAGWAIALGDEFDLSRTRTVDVVVISAGDLVVIFGGLLFVAVALWLIGRARLLWARFHQAVPFRKAGMPGHETHAVPPGPRRRPRRGGGGQRGAGGAVRLASRGAAVGGAARGRHAAAGLLLPVVRPEFLEPGEDRPSAVGQVLQRRPRGDPPARGLGK